ncbi:MAG: exodeoxyribonuclease VII large subunit, partial [Rhizobiales bacterium]|nr:exodeoxyribonuclease VII large subunit [Hyphomicrobiales bacterium]
SYRAVLARGFALVTDAAGTPLRSAAAVAPGDALAIEFQDGKVAATADASGPRAEPRPKAAKAKRGPSGGAPPQASLF